MPTSSGSIPGEVTEAFAEGLFEIPRLKGPPMLAVSAARRTWRIPIIMASYSDQPLQYTAADLEHALFDTTGSTPYGSLAEYYQWVSQGRVKITGRVVATVELPHERAYYGFGSSGLSPSRTPNNAYGAVYDALRGSPDGVDWSHYDLDGDGTVDMLWFVHSGIGGEVSQDRNDLWSITSRMSANWRNGGFYVTRDTLPGSDERFIRIDRFTVLPELSAIDQGALSEIGVYCHEFGHALGLPDLYDTSTRGPSGNVGPGNWSLMSSGAYGADGVTPHSPVHVGAWPARFMGWNQTVRPSRDTVIVIDPIAEGGAIVEWSFQGERTRDYFLIENRQRIGFDQHLLAEGILIYQVDEAILGLRIHSNAINSGPTPGLVLVEADGDADLMNGRNRGDRNDPFPGWLGRTSIDDFTSPSTRTLLDQHTNLALLDVSQQGDRMRVDLRVRAKGWQPNRTHSGAGYRPAQTTASSRVGAIGPDGNAAVLTAEVIAGRPQVVLRESWNNWRLPFEVSNSPGVAVDPALAMLPGGDLATVWADTRSGRSQIYYRSRIRGVWTDEQPLVDLPGEARRPSITADDRGTLSLAFIQVVDSKSRVMFMRFTYFSPFGQPIVVTNETSVPENPAVVIEPLGGAYIGWVERSNGPRHIWFGHYHPDSGITTIQPMTPNNRHEEPAFTMLVDDRGTISTVWQVTGPGVNELRYQRRKRGLFPSPVDQLIESSGQAVQNPVMALDQDGSIHMTFENLYNGNLQARYQHWNIEKGWDARSTEVTLPEDGGAQRVIPLPTSGGDLTVAYLGFRGSEVAFHTRYRALSGPPPPVRKPIVPIAIGPAPNPLRAGEVLRFQGQLPPDAASPWLDVFDISGRRIASVQLAHDGTAWRGSIPAGVTKRWASGVYFARLRGTSAAGRRVVVIR